MGGIPGYMGAGFPPVPIAHFWDIAVITTLFFFAALICAAAQDIRKKEVGDYIHVIIAVTAFIGFEFADLPAMLIGGLVSALPLFIAGMIKKGCIGGADIKLMAASGLILGAGNGIFALIIGLFSGVVCTFMARRIKKADMTTSFPLVPFLAVGCIIATLF
jgi:leader peptidase (prepilin peptidase)/N-methyltransferase